MLVDVNETLNEVDLNQTIQFSYTNYRGEYDLRTVVPIGLRYGNTEWHPEPGWLLKAVDVRKQEIREFALKDCDFTRTA